MYAKVEKPKERKGKLITSNLNKKQYNDVSNFHNQTKTLRCKVTDNMVMPVNQSAKVIQRVRIEPKGINGLTHLVKMTDKGYIYTGENWRENERDEVTTRDKLLVDMDDSWYSHRGINQEANWESDGKEKQKHLWVRVVELNHSGVENGLYVREEMLKDGWDGWEEIPKIMHSIWVQGDFNSNPEAVEGMKSRRGKDTEGWVDMIWLYDTGVALDKYESQEIVIDSEKVAPLMQRSFRSEMVRWENSGNMPEWVQKWLPILDILYKKKSFITMSDLMRMIILYYEGGVYLDVKIKVQPDKALFKERPMVMIDTANFYSSENWAIMANAGCRMIEEMMIAAYLQFPKEDKLESYPPNYDDKARLEGSKREGKMHVELHEVLGVWNVIDRAGRPGFTTSLNLINPRPGNSWSDAYEDRPIEVIRAEQQLQREADLHKIERDITAKEHELRCDKEKLNMKDFVQFWGRLGITKELIESLPNKIHELEEQIMLAKMEYDWLMKVPLPCDAKEDEEGSDSAGVDLISLPSVPVNRQ